MNIEMAYHCYSRLKSDEHTTKISTLVYRHRAICSDGRVVRLNRYGKDDPIRNSGYQHHGEGSFFHIHMVTLKVPDDAVRIITVNFRKDRRIRYGISSSSRHISVVSRPVSYFLATNKRVLQGEIYVRR